MRLVAVTCELESPRTRWKLSKGEREAGSIGSLKRTVTRAEVEMPVAGGKMGAGTKVTQQAGATRSAGWNVERNLALPSKAPGDWGRSDRLRHWTPVISPSRSGAAPSCVTSRKVSSIERMS